MDMKTFKAGQGIVDDKDFLWIAEVAPGLVERMDVTEHFLQQGNYWPSYNIPFTKNAPSFILCKCCFVTLCATLA